MQRRIYLSIAEQVTEHLRDELLRGCWKEFMPGVPSLSHDLGIDPKTVALALEQLEQQGLLESQGAGRRRKILLDKSTAKKGTSIRIALLSDTSFAQSNKYMIELQHRLQEAGHHTFFAPKCLEQLITIKSLARIVKENPADAWVVCAANRKVLEWFLEQNIPTMALFGRRRELQIAGVGPDKVQAFRDVVRKLVSLGHRRIVLLVTKMRRLPYPGMPERAFLDELRAHGIQSSNYNLPDWEESIEGIRDLLDSIFRLTPPTAMLVDEAHIFHAVKHHLSERAIKVPSDVSLVCTDPDKTFIWCTPTIAHIAWDTSLVVRHVVKWASNISRGKQDIRQASTPAVLVVGGTMGPVKKGG